MAKARKIESRRKKFGIKTFGDALVDIWNSFWNMAKNVNSIDIVFDCYRNDSVKGYERKRRSQSTDALRTTVTSVDQPLPLETEFKRF